MMWVSIFRLSGNSRTDHSYQEISAIENGTSKDTPRANTPTNASNTKYSQSQDNQIPNDRMVSPKRKVEHFPHLYVANNVKTASFNEQNEKNNLVNRTLMNNHEYNKLSCSHPPINMVPERDTGPNNVSCSVSTVSSLRLPSNRNSQGSSKLNTGEEHRLVTNRPHHHVSVQELRIQVIAKGKLVLM